MKRAREMADLYACDDDDDGHDLICELVDALELCQAQKKNLQTRLELADKYNRPRDV